MSTYEDDDDLEPGDLDSDDADGDEIGPFDEDDDLSDDE
jgi:hypothetical protein